MPIPDRPVDGAEIATEWGQEIHDRVFAPSGCHVHGSAPQACSTTPAKLQLDTVTDDPGGFLDAANDQVEVPTGKEGLYQVFVSASSVSGSTTDQVRLILQVNGVTVATAVEDSNGATAVVINGVWIGVLSAGDILLLAGQKRGSGTNPSVTGYLFMYRIGAELGA